MSTPNPTVPALAQTALALDPVGDGSLVAASRLPAFYGPTQFPHLTCSGAGTESSPWVHPDGTAGIQTAANALKNGRGGIVRLVTGRYDITNTAGISITSSNIAIIGDGPGFNNDNGGGTGENEGILGAKLRFSGAGFVFSGAAKLLNPILFGFYGYSAPNRLTGSNTGVTSSCLLDNILIERCNFQGWSAAAINLQGSDAGLIKGCSLLYNYNGIILGGSNGGVNKVVANTVADNDGIGVTCGDQYGGPLLLGNVIGRNARGPGGIAIPNASNVYVTAGGTVLSANEIYDAGHDIYANPNTQAAAAGVLVNANGVSISGGCIYGQENGAGVSVASGASNVRIGGAINWTAGSTGAFGGNSGGNVAIASGAGAVFSDWPSLIAPTLLNGWYNFGGGFSPACYWMDSGGVVHLAGMVKGASNNPSPPSVIFQLPVGYRATNEKVFNVANGAGTITQSLVFVDTSGNVTLENGGTSLAWICLDGCSFPAL